MKTRISWLKRWRGPGRHLLATRNSAVAASVPSTTKVFAKKSLARLTPSAAARIPKIAKTVCAARSQRKKFLRCSSATW